ncbi:MAG: GNAT family N-acetyltransferase [Pseudolysinimonas sp.]|uniref:GNAT family N-acetyltransferase n=1 Tax=Pseudolysinimonas sp. TaxID=2680009 RepID=UPI003C75B2B1
MSVNVRPVQSGDADAWRRLFREYGVFYETSFDDAQLDHVWGLLTTEGSGVDALVAEVGGAVVGIAHYRSHPDTFGTGRDWYLDDLFTDPGARGTGVASALIDRLKDLSRATGPGTLRWITAEDNATAQRVYDRLAKRTTWVTYETRA